MQFKTGENVRITITGQEGEIRAEVSDNLYMVWIPEFGREVPFSSEHLSLVEIKKTEDMHTHSILQIAFVESKNNAFDIVLVNGFDSDVWFRLQANTKKQMHLSKTGTVPAQSHMITGSLERETLNDKLNIKMSFGAYTDKGSGPSQLAEFTVRPKQFFNNLQKYKQFENAAWVYSLTKNIHLKPVKRSSESIQEYSLRQQELRDKPKEWGGILRWPGRNLLSFAEFNRVLDLHIAQLVDNHEKMLESRIFALQLSVFEDYVEEALLLGINQVTIIHGVGKGRLRDEIHRRIKLHKDIDNFTNEFDHRYGYGATIINFKK